MSASVALPPERLESLEAEISRLVKLASEEKDFRQQEQYWALAKDLQKEARDIRSTLRGETARQRKS